MDGSTRLLKAREEIAALLSATKWLILVSLVLSVALCLPPQVGELYRVILADRNALDLFQFHVPLLLIAAIVWFGANVLVRDRVREFESPRSLTLRFARAWPIVLGVSPLLSSAYGQLSSVPRLFNDSEKRLQELRDIPGNPWDKFDVELASTVGTGLYWSGTITLIVATILCGLCWVLASPTDRYIGRLATRYFKSLLCFMLTIAFIGILTLAVYASPVSLPQKVGAFGIIALFALCVTAFTTHASLLSARSKIPLIPLLFVAALVVSMASLTDNHGVRLLDKPPPISGQDSVSLQFTKWFEARPDRETFADEYPVYVVAAQGGGIYAANQTALFLARLQDVCPAFRHHLFAISSVSGGSVGAAVFASALDAADRAASAPAVTLARAETSAVSEPAALPVPANPCPRIASFLRRDALGSSPSGAGPIEKRVQAILDQDFLSPLIAAALFPDFSQRFIGYPVAPFDRARALEYAFESSRQGRLSGVVAGQKLYRTLAGGSSVALRRRKYGLRECNWNTSRAPAQRH